MKINRSFTVVSTLLAMAVAVQAQSVFNGNGASGFGNEIGTGTLAISDSPSGMNITLNPGPGGLNNNVALYLDTQPGGFGDTSQFMDGGYGDPGRTAISGYNSSNPSQTIATFPTGFGADYAISIENDFIGVFGLAAGGQNSLNYLFGASQSGNASGPFSISLTPAQMSQIGLTEGSGQTFSFVGSLISGSGYRANETFGPSTTFPANGSDPNAGFNGSQVFSGADSYTLQAVPEPATLSLVCLGLGGLLSARRRK